MPEDLLNMEKCGTETVLEYPLNYPAFGQFHLVDSCKQSKQGQKNRQ